MFKECFYSWYGIFSFPLRFPFLSSIFSFFLFSFFSSCQSYHFALGVHFSGGALMGAVMESWVTGRADFHTLIMTSPLARFHFTSNHIKTGWLEGEKHQTTSPACPPPPFHWGNNVQCGERLQQKWSLCSKLLTHQSDQRKTRDALN